MLNPFWTMCLVQMRDARGTEFSRFLPLATDEGESQPVGGPCVSKEFVNARHEACCLAGPGEYALEHLRCKSEFRAE